MPLQSASRLAAIAWSDDAPVIIDQRRLPEALVHWRLTTVDDLVAAIRTLAVRGAPAIGVTGAFGIVARARESGSPGWGRAIRDLDSSPSGSPAPARPRSTYPGRSAACGNAARRAPRSGPSFDTALVEASAIYEEDRRPRCIWGHGADCSSGRDGS